MTNEQREAKRQERYRAIIRVSDLFNEYGSLLKVEDIYYLLKTPTISRKTLKRIYKNNVQQMHYWPHDLPHTLLTKN
jgi:hypothetical protein